LNRFIVVYSVGFFATLKNIKFSDDQLFLYLRIIRSVIRKFADASIKENALTVVLIKAYHKMAVGVYLHFFVV